MFEHILIKQLLVNKEFFSKAVTILKPQYFNNQGTSKIFEILHKHYIEYKEVPNTTEIVAQIKNVPNAELRKSIIDDLQASTKMETIDNTQFILDETVTFCKDALYTEALILGSDALTEKNEDKKAQAKQLMEDMSKISIDTDLGLDFDDIAAMIEYYQNRLYGIKTQHTELNKRLGTGFLPGTLSIIMAASGIGKSLLMTDILSGNIKDNKNILLVSMEMQDAEVMKRVHANALDLEINHLTDLALTNGQKDSIRKKDAQREFLTKEDIIQKYNNLKLSGKCGKLFIKDYPNGTFSPLMLDALLDNYKLEKGITFDIIYLDYLGIMKSDLVSPNAGLYSYVKSIVEETRSIAKKHQIPIISASQLNRCLFKDTSISLANGNTKKIKDIKVNDKLLDNKSVCEVIHSGKQECFEIKTKKGKKIICSENHKIPTNEGTMTVKVGLKEGQCLNTK